MVLLATADKQIGLSGRLAAFDPALMAALDRPKEALAGKSTLDRLEHAGKIGRDPRVSGNTLTFRYRCIASAPPPDRRPGQASGAMISTTHSR